MKDFSTSKFENALAEEAFEAVLEGGSDDSISEGDAIKFDLVRLDDEREVILRLDDQGFVWIEASGRDVSARWNELMAMDEADE